jgi:hypothetical protein
MNADKSRNKDKEKDASLSSQQSSTHKVGRNVMDTADVARASISKGLRAPEDVSAADIVKGISSSDEIISYSTGIRPEDGKVIDPDREVSIAKHLNKDITNTEDVSKDATRRTSSTTTKSGRIDRAVIYSDDGTRNIEKAQETPTEEVEDKQTGSWKIKEKDNKRGK